MSQNCFCDRPLLSVDSIIYKENYIEDVNKFVP